MGKTTFNDIYLRHTILQQIPTEIGEKEMPAELAVDVLLLQTAYKRKVSEFEDFMSDVLKGLKKVGFDERAQKVQTARDIIKHADEDGDNKPSEDEVKKANEDLKDVEEFDAEFAELNSAYSEARRKKAEEETSVKNGYFTRESFARLVGYIGLKGEMETKNPVNGEKVTVLKSAFLSTVSDLLVAND